MDGSHELEALGGEPMTAGGTFGALRGKAKHRKDSRTLARLGKNQVLKVSYEGV